MTLQEFKQEQLKNPKFAEEYYRYDLPFEVSFLIKEARAKRGITQEQLADMVGTKQSAIARAENCSNLPSLSFLKKIGDVLGEEIQIGFKNNVVISWNTNATMSISNNL